MSGSFCAPRIGLCCETQRGRQVSDSVEGLKVRVRGSTGLGHMTCRLNQHASILHEARY